MKTPWLSCVKVLDMLVLEVLDVFWFAPGDPCPVGTYNNLTGLRAANECIPCDPGQYCPSPGLIVPYAYCTAGYYCEYGSNEPSPKGQSYGYNCPSGHYCPEGIPAPVPCPQGTYQPSEGRQSTRCRSLSSLMSTKAFYQVRGQRSPFPYTTQGWGFYLDIVLR